ncbi:MAG: hypothetical protein CMF22_07745 [Idiomarinaceae bacterium]|nr:hypothetical protein [Idiomarinaceae bacterium]|tara:strand:- start:6945 stop:7427 length:483 start_codon:yes stop_codon:yes gene_type:complete
MKTPFKLLLALSFCSFSYSCASTNSADVQPISATSESTREVAMRAYAEGDFHLAEGLLRTLAEAPVYDPQAPCFLGAIHYRQHAYQAALRRFEECRNHFPERAEIWFNTAATHLRLATEALLTGRSYQNNPSAANGVHQQYERLLQALMELQRVHTKEVR